MKKSWRTLAALTAMLAFFGFGLASCHGGDDDDPELKLSASANTVEVGSSITITAKYDGKDVTALAEFSSLDESKAVVELSEETAEDGTVTTVAKVTGKDSGTVEIQAKYKDTKKVKITVTPKTADSSTVAGTYTFGDSTVVIASDGTVTITSADGTATTGAVEIAENGDIIIKSSDGSTLYTAEANSDGTINTEAVTDSNGSTVAVKELEKSFDGSLFLKLDSEPAYTADSKVYVLQGTAVVDTITLDDKYYTISNSKGTISEIKVEEQLIDFDDEGNVVIVTHTDSKGYSKLYADTEYTVKIDDKVIGTYTTKVNPTISDNAISVGTDGDFATIQGALNYLRATEATGDWTINVASGEYHEILAYFGSANVKIVGADVSDKGKNQHVYWKNNQKMGNSQRSRQSFIWQGGNLTVENMYFENTSTRAKYGNVDLQAETLYFDCAKDLVVYNSSFYSYQDTLLIGTSGGRAWFYKCKIAGDIDFIWGQADVCLVEECNIICRADGVKNQAHIFASRTPKSTDNKIGKGFVLMNSDVVAEKDCKVNYGRNSGSDTQALVINNKFTGEGTINDALWGSAAGVNANDVADEPAVGYKDYNNTMNGTIIDTSKRLDKTWDLTKRVADREYNGRYVIFNRIFNIADGLYEAASSIWNPAENYSDASADASLKDVFIEPVATYKVIGGATVQLSATSFESGATIAYSLEEKKADDNTVETIGSVDATTGLVTTTSGAHGTLTVTATTSSGAKDIAYVYVIPTDIKATAVTLESVTDKEMVLDDVQWITATLVSESSTEEVTDQSITWSATEGIKFYLSATGELSDTLTTAKPTVGIYVASVPSTGKATITAKSAYASATTGTVEITLTNEGKEIGEIPAAGYTFNLIGPDSDATDELLNGAKTPKPTHNYNVGSTTTEAFSKMLGTGGKYITLLKNSKEPQLKDTYFKLKSNQDNTISASGWTKMSDSNSDGIPETDALLLQKVKGPFKITVVETQKAGSSRFIAIKAGTEVVTYDAVTDWQANGHSLTYEGTDTVDVAIASSNDVYLKKIVLEAYNPDAATVTLESTYSVDMASSTPVKATATASDGAPVTYTSGNEDVFTVGTDGTLTGKIPGVATLTASTATATKAATAKVTVKNTGDAAESYSIDFSKGWSVQNEGAGDYGIFSTTGNYWNDYGFVFNSGNTLSVKVAGSSTITLLNTYANSAVTITPSTTVSGGSFSSATITASKINAQDSTTKVIKPEEVSVIYQGDAGIVTFTFGGQDYMIGYKVEKYESSTKDISISYASKTANMDVSDTAKVPVELSVTGTNSSEASVKYTSSKTNVATVDADGKVTPLTVGVTTIGASEETTLKSASYDLTVKQNEPTESMTFDFRTGAIVSGTTATSYDYGVLSGTQTSLNGSQHGIAVENGGTLVIKVKGPSSIYIGNESNGAGGTWRAVKTSSNTDVTDKLSTTTYAKANSTISTNYTGLDATTKAACQVLRYKGEESATITLTTSGQAYFPVIWVEKYEVPNVTVTAKFETASKSIEKGQSDTQTVTTTVSDGSTPVIEYKSSQPTVATVDESGKVTAVAMGTAIITATVTHATEISASEKATYYVVVKDSSAGSSDYSATLNGGLFYDGSFNGNVTLDFGAWQLNSGSSNAYSYSSGHGIIFKNGNNVALTAKAKSEIKLTLCAFDNAYKITVSDGSNAIVATANLTVADSSGRTASIKDGVISVSNPTYQKEGDVLTIGIPENFAGNNVVLTWSEVDGNTYIHKIEVTIPSE